VQNAELLTGRLQTIEAALESQRTRELEAMQGSNRSMLLAAGSFAGVGLIAVLVMSFFQNRTVNRLAEISAALPASLALAQVPTRNALGPGERVLVTDGRAEQSSSRLLGALENLEKRIYELEHTTRRTPLEEGKPIGNAGSSESLNPTENGGSGLGAEPDRVSVLMGKGQSMLNLADPQSAASCFDEVLALDPNNADAWVRKGIALEQLQNQNEAVECYDRAIAADGSLTIAYLHKGGLFNRMERFNEALECYERALQTQEKRHA
jgi:tetratricopeptide (TPR) repeat protein